MITTERIVLGLSGGVDSSVAAIRLKEMGYEVVATSILFSAQHEAEVSAAAILARELGIDHHVVDKRLEFETEVLANFCETYENTGTPNPCVQCNPSVKLLALTELADSLSIEKIATGHYASVEKFGCHYLLYSAKNTARDQSYMLYRVPQEILSRLVLPLSELGKDVIRETAKENSLSSADRPDSQELCFCDDYVEFLKSRGVPPKIGDFVLPNGVRIAHKGSYNYTIGQRKGLGVYYASPLFVKSINENADIVLAERSELFSKTVIINNIAFNPYFAGMADIPLFAKVRSTAPLSPCIIKSITENGMTVEFSQPVFAPAKGQSLVIYTVIGGRNVVIAGGVIGA